MKNNEITKRPDMSIFNKQFPVRLMDAPIDDPTKFTILTGDDGILDDLFSYQVYNHIKNHWRGAAAPADIQDGMIWSSTTGDKLYHEASGDEEILQLTRSFDVSPYFTNLYLAEYIYHTGDLDTYVRFQTDAITLRAGGVDFLNLVEAATNYLELLTGLVFIGDIANTKMTIGLTINQAGNDDEILAFKSSDVGHGITDFMEDDTYGCIKKRTANEGGVLLIGATEDDIALGIHGYYTNDNTTKSTAGNAPIELNVSKKVGTGLGAQGADANIVAMRSHGSTRWILDEDGDTWQTGDITMSSATSTITGGTKLILAAGASGVVCEDKFSFGAPTELTIAGGVITVTGSYHLVDTQGEGPADDLVTINGGVDGMLLILRAVDSARDVTVKNTGNILPRVANRVMGLNSYTVVLLYDDILSKWIELGEWP